MRDLAELALVTFFLLASNCLSANFLTSDIINMEDVRLTKKTRSASKSFYQKLKESMNKLGLNCAKLRAYLNLSGLVGLLVCFNKFSLLDLVWFRVSEVGFILEVVCLF